MKILPKTLTLAATLMVTISVFGYFITENSRMIFYPPHPSNSEKREISKTEILSRLKEKITIAKDYVDEKGFDVSYCFFIDMRLPSGKNRFFIYNLLKDSMELEALVTHGKGSDTGTDDLFFSNKPNSNCTSLGKYKIGSSYNGSFGLAYRLYGLEKTNDKAYERSVVLHSYFGVPKEEVYPEQLCLSEGCPAVSPETLAKVKEIIDESQEPIMLWIYY